MGIWGDLVKRTRPTSEACQEHAAGGDTSRPAQHLPLLEEDAAPLPTNDARQATVVLTSALSRPLVLTPLPDDFAADPPKFAPLAPPKTLPVPEKTDPFVALDVSLPALLERLRATVPEATPAYTPEQAIAFLSALPAQLSCSARYEQMEEELSRVSPDHQDLAAELVGEAAARLVDLRRELTTGQIAHGNYQKVERSRREALEAELTRLRAELEDRECLFQQQRQETLTHLDEMTGVIVFFDAYQAHRFPPPQSQSEREELPAFLREETAAKLLGIKTPPSAGVKLPHADF